MEISPIKKIMEIHVHLYGFYEFIFFLQAVYLNLRNSGMIITMITIVTWKWFWNGELIMMMASAGAIVVVLAVEGKWRGG